MTPRRAFLTGLLAAPVLLLALVAVSVFFWPDWPILGEMARIIDGAVPQIIVAGTIAALGLAMFRAPKGVVILALAGFLVAAGLLVTRHVSHSLPLARDETTDLTILWFNVLSDNRTDPKRLARALMDSPADIVMLGEASPLAGQQELLARTFPFRSGCAPGEAASCQVMVLARHGPVNVVFHHVGRIREPRVAVVTGSSATGMPFSIVAMHLVKPWFRGFAESEEWQTVHVLNDISGPVVAVGDLNAAPWSRRVSMLSERCGLMSPRLPPPTWPVAAGWLGVPIDHVMVRGDARLTSLETWGEDLGSNHLGLLAGIALPDGGERMPAPHTCRPPRSRWDPAAR
jgi:endonuclease/exonuclease/phosphatase (EEP) superfamily protein YafD